MNNYKNFNEFYNNWRKIYRNTQRLKIATSLTNQLLLSISLSLVLLTITKDIYATFILFALLAYLSTYNAFNNRKAIPKMKSLLVAIDIKNPKTLGLIYNSKKITEEYLPALNTELDQLKGQKRKLLRQSLKLLVILLLTTTTLIFVNADKIKHTTKSLAMTAFSKNTEIFLDVTKGNKTETENNIKLSRNKVIEVDLYENNSIKIHGFLNHRSIQDGNKLVLYKTNNEGEIGEILYEFTLKPYGKKNNKIDIEFTVPQTAALIFPEYSTSKPVAVINVERLPIPEVTLTWKNKSQMTSDKTWIDDNELELSITALGYQPLDKVELDILVAGKKHTELVTKVINSKKLNLVVDYSALLEKYLDQDYANISLYAKVTDRSSPLPLTGISNEIAIKVESAYARYLSSLQALKEANQYLYDLQSKWDNDKYSKLTEAIQSSFDRSMDSPFFDFLDRSKLNNFSSVVLNKDNLKKQNSIHILNNDITEFLEEHQSINDRERDRDFFVAVRTLSRLLETEQSQQLTNVSTIVLSLERFLEGRKIRWKKRVSYLPKKYKPEKFKFFTSKKAFSSDLKKISTKVDPTTKDSNMKITMKLTRDYKKWIEDLEAAEDKYREDRKTKQEQSLSESQQVIRKLRERQEKISSVLDFASKKNKSNLEQKWFETRIEQNTNIKQTQQVSSQARSHSPKVYEKLVMALEFMKNTNKFGNKSNFVTAESNSDQAGRSLRLADQAAAEQRRNMQQSGKKRRRRRTTGDSYFGSNFVESSMEIQRSYEVDKRYRGDILDQILEMPANQKQEAILDSYLKEVTR